MEERDGLGEEVRRRLEVGIEHGDELAAPDVGVAHPLLEVPGLVPRSLLVPGPVLARLVLDVDPLRRPPLALALHQLLPIQINEKIPVRLSDAPYCSPSCGLIELQ